MSETTNICTQVDRVLWERHRAYQMKGEDVPLLTIVFNPPAFADFKNEISRNQMYALEIGTRVDRYRGATLGVVYRQVEAFRVVER